MEEALRAVSKAGVGTVDWQGGGKASYRQGPLQGQGTDPSAAIWGPVPVFMLWLGTLVNNGSSHLL